MICEPMRRSAMPVSGKRCTISSVISFGYSTTSNILAIFVHSNFLSNRVDRSFRCRLLSDAAHHFIALVESIHTLLADGGQVPDSSIHAFRADGGLHVVDRRSDAV